MQLPKLVGSTVLGLCLASTTFSLAWAEEGGEIEEIVVTGSYIARSIEEQAQPVDVFDRNEFEAQGSPQAVEIIQNTPSMSGTLNQSEQYQGSGTATGLKNVNIRGLGAERTLVLLNSKRMAVTGASVGKGGQYVVDIGNFPGIAMERIELLKNGGAVTYGTDAIAGVWNYITRDEFEGLEINFVHSDYDHSDGDQTIGAIWGVAGDNSNWVTSFEYEKRNRLPIPDRGLAVYNGTSNGGWPLGNSSFGNPGTFHAADFSATVVDPECGREIGPAVAYPIEGNALSQCGYSYMNFANIIDDQRRLKLFSQVKFDINDYTQLYGEVLWADLETVYEGSPSYPPTNPGADFFTYVPLNNPGMVDFLDNDVTAAERAAFEGAGGALWWGRSLAIEGPAVEFPRKHETLRLVTGLRGQFSFAEEYGYDVSVAYSEVLSNVEGTDVLTDRFDLAVQGLGGFECDPDTNAPGDPGCLWFNPFGSSIDAADGSALNNSREVRDWFTGYSAGITKNRYMVTDLVFNGPLGGLEIPGGAIQWAAGAQYRWYESEYNPTGDNRVDGPQPSPFHFLGISAANYLETKNWALFGEMIFPILDTLDVELGVRYEDYDADAVTKPKLAARWDATDWMTLRFSYEEVFRVPTIPSQPQTSLELFAPAGEYLSIITPVPTALDPEEATNFNFGVIFGAEGFNFSIDYYEIALEGPFGREAATCACATKYNSDGSVWNPGDPVANISYIETELINGEDVTTNGLDFELTYNWEMGPGFWTVGANANYILKYEVDGELGPDGEPTGDSYRAEGFYNVRSGALPIETRPMPELKMNTWLSFTSGNHYARLYARYVDSYKIDDSFASAGAFPELMEDGIDDHLTWDLHYSYSFLDDSLRLTLSALNLTDEDPPVAPHEQAYDAYTHNGLGRVIRIGVNYRLGPG